MKLFDRIYTLVAIGLFLALAVLTFLQKQPPFWDESYYLDNVDILKQFGWSREFLLNYKGPAGPTFAIVHYLLLPITELTVPMVRMVNIAFLVGVMYVTFLTLKKIGGRKPGYGSLAILAIPTVYTMAGLVLTEMMAVFFLSLSVYLILSAYKDNKINYLNALLAGFSMSLAILGRQPLLLIVLCLPLLVVGINQKKIEFHLVNKKFLLFLAITIITSMLLPIWVFSVWGNIQPEAVAFTGIGLEPDHLLLALAYAGMHLLFINPSYFNLNTDFSNKKELAIVIIASFLANILLFKVSFAPLNTIVGKILPEHLLPFYALFCGALLAVLGISFGYFFLKKQLSQGSGLSLFLSAAFLLVVLSSLKVTHQFSARYVAQAFPLLILCVTADKKEISVGSILSLLAGGILGLVSLESYFN